MAIDGNGCILVAGTSTQPYTGKDFALARFNPDGTLDTSFGSGGMVTTDIDGCDDVASAMAIQPDGNIVLAGYSDDGTGNDSFAVVRYDTYGNLDGNFGGGSGIVTTSFGDGHDRATGVQIQSDGKIVVGGSTFLDGTGAVDSQPHFAFARYNADGSLDGNFGTGAGRNGNYRLQQFRLLHGIGSQDDVGLDGTNSFGWHGNPGWLQQFRRRLLRSRHVEHSGRSAI